MEKNSVPHTFFFSCSPVISLLKQGATNLRVLEPLCSRPTITINCNLPVITDLSSTTLQLEEVSQGADADY